MGVGIHRAEGRNVNVQRSTSNVQRPMQNLESLNVERWTLDVSSSNKPLAQDVSSFRRALLAWYRKNGRELPWRHTRDPYAILVSEFMLQQTQVATVIPYYRTLARRFPDFASLARATESDVLHAWQGLGYYRAPVICMPPRKQSSLSTRGVFPKNVEQIRALPGLGRYTANAVATFAFNQSVPVVEANIGRLLARLLEPTNTDRFYGGSRANLGLRFRSCSETRSAHFNSALMDLGALVCKARQPRCEHLSRAKILSSHRSRIPPTEKTATADH